MGNLARRYGVEQAPPDPKVKERGKLEAYGKASSLGTKIGAVSAETLPSPSRRETKPSETKPKGGRPRTRGNGNGNGNAVTVTAAEKQRAYRERQKAKAK